MDSRNSITHFFQIQIDDSPESKLRSIEYLLDLDYTVGLVREILIKLADAKEE